MANPPTRIRLKTNIRKIHEYNLDEDAGVLRYQSCETNEHRSAGNTRITFTAAEQKAVHRAFLRRFVSDEARVATMGKDDLLAKKPYAESQGSAVDYVIILTVYEGQGPPPDDLTYLDYNSAFKISQFGDSADQDDDHVMEYDNGIASPKPVFEEWAGFKRSRPSFGDTGSSTQRRFRIHAAECDDYQVSHDNEHAIFSNDNSRFYIMPMKLISSTLSVRDAFSLASNASDHDPDAGEALQQFLDLVGDVDYMKYQLDSQGQPSDERVFPGVCAVTKQLSHIRINHNNDLVLSDKSQTGVYLQSDFKTLADFVTEHCRADLHRLQSSRYVPMLTKKLRGTHVKIATPGGSESRMVVDVVSGTGPLLDPNHKHHAWPSKSGLVLSPSLPLVNVGSKDRPLVLPMEACQIQPLQRLRGRRDLGLNVHISSKDREAALANLPESCEDVNCTMIHHQLPHKSADEQSHRLVEACDDNFPNLLFVEAGPASTDHSIWTDLRNAIKDWLQQSFKKYADLTGDPAPTTIPNGRGDSLPVKRLRCVPGDTPTEGWTGELQELFAESPGVEQKTMIVVLLQPGDDYNIMYNAIKKACDTVVGAQTFFVKRAMLEATIRKALNAHDVIKRSAGEICLRMIQKNSKMLTAESLEKSKLVIAMHVSQITSKSASKQERSKMYLVTLVIRDHASSEQYRTVQKLWTEDDFKYGRHSITLNGFLNSLPELRAENVTILRSGHMLPSADFLSLETQTWQSRVAFEIGKIAKIFANYRRFGAFSYVTLTEDSTLETRMTSAASHAYQGLGNNPPAILFIEDRLLIAPKVRSIKVQQVPRVLSQRIDGKGPEVRRGAITATFYHSQEVSQDLQVLKLSTNNSLAPPKANANRAASQSRPHLDSQGRIPPMGRSTPSRSVSRLFKQEEELETPSPQAKSTTETHIPDMTESATPEGTYTDANLDFLAAIWKDEGLGLYSTKWPVPTHLAHLATKRARIYLEENGDSGLSQSSLPDVHENVRNTLYYL